MNIVRHIAFALLSVALLGWAGSEAGARTDPCAPGNLSGRLLVRAKSGIDGDEVVREVGRRLRVRRLGLRRIRGIDVHVVDAPAAHLQGLCAVLASDPRVGFAELDRIVPPAAVEVALAEGRDHLARIGATDAWDVTVGDPDVAIAVLDSGVDAAHPDLAGRVLPGRNVYDGNDDTSDVGGHGTLVAGVVGAVANNGIGIDGLTWENPILPVRITDRSGNATYATIAEGLVWAADQGARVANVSFGVFGAQAIKTAAEYFVQGGGLVFAAGGNDGMRHPDQDNPWVVSVAATDDADEPASFSSYGPYIDLAAPGVAVLSTANGGGYARITGTSIASPIAAGVAALVMAANPRLTPIEVEDLLKAHSADLGAPGYDPYFGWGRVDAGRAAEAASLIRPTDDSTPPFAVITSPGAGATLRGTITVKIEAGDVAGVAAVELQIDGAPIATSRQQPHAFAWDTRAWPNGPHRLIARVTDADGNSSTSGAIEVSVANLRDDTPPRLRLRVSRSRSRNLQGRIAVRVWAADESPVGQITLFVDGSPVAAKVGSSLRTLRFVWDTRDGSNGVHLLSAGAVDGAGNYAASLPLGVRVENRRAGR